MLSINDSPYTVAEMQSPYGPIRISESIIHKIWLHRAYANEPLKTICGQAIEVIHPGSWEPSSGPDFKDAQLRVNGRIIQGDVEIHFYAKDWHAHKHSDNKDFNHVVLHVFLYGSKEENDAIPSKPLGLQLLPYLNADLESYAYEDALLENTITPSWLDALTALEANELRKHLYHSSHYRWQQKVVQHKQLLQKNSWEEALHLRTLEVLGYRRNKHVMHTIGTQYKRAQFTDPELDILSIYNDPQYPWHHAGIRPANQPKLRLKQYHKLNLARPDWPQQVLQQFSQALPAKADPSSVAKYRSLASVSSLSESVRACLDHQISGTRFHTWCVDALFPLLTAYSNQDYFNLWYVWPAGDLPTWVSKTLRSSGYQSRSHPYCNGAAQALLYFFFNDSIID